MANRPYPISGILFGNDRKSSARDPPVSRGKPVSPSRTAATADLSQLKTAMAAAHPDLGCTEAAFTAVRER
jgi:hypothetical protein